MTNEAKNRTIVRGTAVVLATAVALTGTGVAAAAAGRAQQAGSGGTGVDDRLQREVARHVLDAGPPGYLARIDDGRRVHTLAAGVADRRTGRPITVRDQFEAGSNTKTFTAVLILQQVDRGKIALDAPVEKYLPGLVPNGRNITVRMLLNHTSGLFSYTGDPDFFVDMERDPQHVHTDAELIAIAFAHEPYFAPGKGWQYSNTNYTLLGMILSKQTGKSLPTLVKERITGPLGLKHTYFADPRATNTGPGYARGYAIKYASGTPQYTDTSSWPIGAWGGAAGAMITTADDLARFFSAVLQGKLFSAAQLKQMKTTVPLPADVPVQGGYGLGLIRTDSPCGTVWGHGGDTMGHHSTAAATENGRRTAITDATGEPADLTENPGMQRYYQAIVFGADTVNICQMLGKPVPAEVLDNLRGSTSTADVTK
ncbi:D-alanyl-D-alanine carboxypeptidase [Actinoplanes lutulentus]|uniref:D-alanyl-D-alanine carboxypeptidase n=1 Tax=Actinoplanes lutulentus TaxID=1287878 RepID=A0A327Z0H1_9ACTN|nr:serine hydrolase domain-containing protein [Actinoplanes lutulentus]MBB2946439.1 D-alanyl-D-alanine carboxypeptidase [Actinoplanes lutulentus]RAK25415.1 D-alanyl-D-alanine carboxypeptidase [Actinoplanes lutulentus]